MDGMTEKLLDVASVTVWQSGAAAATVCAPISPLAPGRFSMTRFRPVRSDTAGPTMRIRMSAPPPAGKATITLSDLDAAPCAAAAAGKAETASTPARNNHRVVGLMFL